MMDNKKCDILHGDTLALARMPLAELMEQVLQIAEWTEPHAAVLDDLYRGWVVKTLIRRRDGKEVRLVHEHIARAAGVIKSVQRTSGWAKDWAESWNSYAAILAAYLGALQSQKPSGVYERAYVKELLTIVCQNVGATETGIKNVAQETLDLQADFVLELLELMEANDLIERYNRKAGTELCVFLGRNAPPE